MYIYSTTNGQTWIIPFKISITTNLFHMVSRAYHIYKNIFKQKTS